MGGESPAKRCACLAQGFWGHVGTADSQVLKKPSPLSAKVGGPGTSPRQVARGEVGDFRLFPVPAPGGRYRLSSGQLPVPALWPPCAPLAG